MPTIQQQANSYDTLPLDVFHLIFDVLATESDLETLKSCSLACKILHPLCEKHIFASIDIVPYKYPFEERPPVLWQFTALLEGNPKIATYVKTLNLCIQEYYLEEGSDLPHTLDQLHNIKSFSLSAANDLLYWKAISQPLLSSLERIIQSSNLIRFDVASVINFPISTFAHSVGLQKLGLSNIEVSDDSLLLPDTTSTLRLTHFSTTSQSTSAMTLIKSKLPNGLPVFDFSNLSDLSFEIEEDGDAEPAAILLESALKLKTLKCRVSFRTVLPGSLFKSIHPSSKRTIQELILGFEVMGDNEDPYHGVCDELKSLASTSPIENVEVNVLVLTDYTCATTRECWDKLDGVLTISNFPSLRQVTIHVTIARFTRINDILKNKLLDMAEVSFTGLKGCIGTRFQFFVTYEDIWACK
ncbi:hypothetical protein BDZ97DRAFT_1653631 [Flammula alnicola]|nr:hypothetical protein BDZ97DRAFT_1653631 [Flammula alnicola]